MSDELILNESNNDDTHTDPELRAIPPWWHAHVDVPRRPLFMKVKLEQLPEDFQAAIQQFQQTLRDSNDQLAKAVKKWNQVGFPSSATGVVESSPVLPLESSPALSVAYPTADNASQPSRPFLVRSGFHDESVLVHFTEMHFFLDRQSQSCIDTALGFAQVQWGITDIGCALAAICKAYIASREEPA